MRRLVLVLVVLVALASAGCEVFPAPEADPARDRMFERETGWTGADAAYSIALTSSVSLWLFGDTLLDRWSDHAKMVRNSIGVQRGSHVDFAWGKGDGDFFAPRTEGTWLWPGDGALDGGEVVLFLHEFKKTGEGAFGFELTGSWLARIENPLDAPRVWRVRYEKLPWFGPGLYYGTACLRRGETLYVYGALEEGPRRSLVVARVVAGRWEYLGEEGWKPTPGEPKRLCDGVGAELSVTPGGRGRVYLVTTENGLSANVTERVGETPEGPFHAPCVIFTCPEPTWDKSYFTYAAKAHAELAREGEAVVITYCCNSTDFGTLFRDRRIYRPRFVVVR